MLAALAAGLASIFFASCMASLALAALCLASLALAIGAAAACEAAWALKATAAVAANNRVDRSLVITVSLEGTTMEVEELESKRFATWR